MNTLSRDGVTGSSETSLGWFLVITSCAVVLIITVLVCVAGLRKHRAGAVDVVAGSAGFEWILWGGMLVPAVVLVVAFLLNIGTLEVRYEGSSPDLSVVTANEIHVPVGEPVRLELSTGDVIHSFWVPELAGKTDLIPGQTNTMWIEARHAGVFGGTCGEFCGAQHAHMQMRVIADPPGKYQAWLAAQRAPAAAASEPSASDGLRVFMTSGCANCHAIRGTGAGGGVGPDLTHIASRTTIAAGTLPNTEANLMGWIVGAQAIKPCSDMPNMPVPSRDLQTLAAYLETLK